jgi:hypothetical protein
MITAAVLREYMNQSNGIQLHMADGRKIEVPHGEYLALHPSGRMFIVFTPQAFEVFNLTMLTSIRVKGSSAKKEK